MDTRRWLICLRRAACIGGAVLLTVGLLLNIASAPVRAQEETPQGSETEEAMVSVEETTEVPGETTLTTEATPVPGEEVVLPTEEPTLAVEETATPTEEIIDSSQVVESTETTPELFLICVSTTEDGGLVATLSDGSQLAVVDGSVEGTQIVVEADAPRCEEPSLDRAIAATDIRYAVSGSSYTTCSAVPDDIHADFEVNVSGLPSGYEGLELFVMDPYGNVTSYPLSSEGGNVTINDTWPGITDVNSVIWMSWSAYLYDNGNQMADAVASISYDPHLGDAQNCTSALTLAAPSCDPTGVDQFVWYSYNPNPWAAEYQLLIDGSLAGSGWMPPAGGGAAEAYFLGFSAPGNHTAELIWVGLDGKGAALTAGEELSCTNQETAPQPPEQSYVPPTASEPVALEAPVEEGLPILIPVTGTDLNSLPTSELLGRLFTSLGLLMGGVGLIMRGCPKR